MNNKKAVVSQGNRAMQRVFSTPSSYLLQVPKGQSRYSNRVPLPLSKSRLNVKLKVNNLQHHGALVLQQST